MTTEIYEAIFNKDCWGRTSREMLIKLEPGQSISGKDLEDLGIKIRNLERIVDQGNVTIVESKKDKKVSFQTIMSNPFEVECFSINKGSDVGIRTTGRIKTEIIGIQLIKD